MALWLSPTFLRHAMNLWPPFRGAGIRVTAIARDWSTATVELRDRFFNRNFVGTHFGGSLFAMTDPFYVIMLIQRLGRDYVVWDRQSEIEYLRPGRGTVRATLAITPEDVASLRQAALGGARVLRDFSAEIRDAEGELVARVKKQLYVRLKKRQREDADSGT